MFRERDCSTGLKTCLKKYWGYSYFLEGQLEICLNILNAKDCFVIMATGSGKSLTFQLPAVYLRDIGVRSTTIVVSPLISLIDDQVSSLLTMGIPCCAIGSNSSVDIEQRAMRGEFTVVYATPEKLLTWQHGLKELSSVVHITCFAVDESHCVSEWGHDFRPDYRRLGELRDTLGPKVPWIGLTASATKAVQADIIRNLRLNQPLVAKASLNRPNLKYCVINRTGPNDLLRLILEYRKEQLLSYPDSIDKSTVPFYSTLVYVNSKKETEELAKLLVACRLLNGIKVAYYHAGMQAADRSAVHMAFMKDEVQVVIATIAFGMGINKPDVRMVIHFGMTKSVESYYQQTGRAGRDGLPAKCVLLFSRQDVVRCFNISSSSMTNPIGVMPTCETSQTNPNTSVALTTEQLKQQNSTQRLNHQINCMRIFATSCGEFHCRRKFLMHYFDESLEELQITDIPTPVSLSANGMQIRYFASRNCCDLCDDLLRQHESAAAASTAVVSSVTNTGSFDPMLGVGAAAQRVQQSAPAPSTAVEDVDISKEVHMLLSTVIDCGEVYGAAVPLAVLLGKHDKSVQRVHNYATLPHFGCGVHHSQEWWKELLHQLGDTDGYVEAVLTKLSSCAFSYQRYVVTPQGRAFLNGLQHQEQNLYSSGTERHDFNSIMHRYKTPPSRELRKMLQVEENMKRPPLQQHVPRMMARASTYNGQQSTVSSDCASGRTLFNFVPQSMAFDTCKVSENEQLEINIIDRKKLSAELHSGLERQLRQTRNEIAQRSGLNPYNVLVTADAAELLRTAPESLDELGRLPGWGDWKLQNFGQAFVDTIKQYKRDHAQDYASLLPSYSVSQKQSSQSIAAGGQQLLNAQFSPGAGLMDPTDAAPVRPVVKLYRPNYVAATASDRTLSEEATFPNAAVDPPSIENQDISSQQSADECKTGMTTVAEASKSSEPQPLGLQDLNSSKPRPPAAGVGIGGSAFAVAAKKRMLASTGIAAFKAKKEAKLTRASTDPTALT